jgi:hypothetical protein
MERQAGEYCSNAYLTSYGVETMRAKMTRRYGQRYLDYRQRWARAETLEALDFPVNLELDLIDACTLSCPQCLRSPDLLPKYKDFLGKGGRLTYDQVVRLLDEGQRYELPSVNIGGSGECMLHPDFLRICRAIMDHDVLELRIISNGTRLTETIATGLIDQQVHFLSISIDAMSPESYGRVRGKPALFEKVVAAVNSFLALRATRQSEFPMLRVTFVRQPANEAETEAFIDYWTDKADLIDIQSYADYRNIRFKKSRICNHPWKRLAVYADEHIAPCCGFPGIALNLGSIHETTLYDVWHGERLRSLRRALRDGRLPAPCIECIGSLG